MVEPGFGGLPFHNCLLSLNPSLSLNILALCVAINMILLGFEVIMSG